MSNALSPGLANSHGADSPHDLMLDQQYGSESTADNAARFQDALAAADALPSTFATLQPPVNTGTSASDPGGDAGGADTSVDATAAQQQPGVAADAAAADTQAPTHEQRVQQAVTYFEGQGWTQAQAVGIVANLDAESGLDPHSHQQGGGPGYGLGQWEHPRQQDFQAWAGHDIQHSTFAEQMRFTQHELTGTQSAAGNALRRATTAQGAASAVTRLYERPADTAGEAVRRADRARQIENHVGH